MPLPPSELYPIYTPSGIMQRIGRYLQPAQVQASGPGLGAPPPPRTPFEGMPQFPPMAPGISQQGGMRSYGELPPVGGVSHGWMGSSAPPSRFDPSILTPPPEPTSGAYMPALRGSVADLEGRANARRMIDDLYPELTPAGRAQSAQVEYQTRMLTPLRAGEEPPRLPQEAIASRQRMEQGREMQDAFGDWQARQGTALKELGRQYGTDPSSDPQGTRLDPQRRQQYLADLQGLRNAFGVELQTLKLRFAKSLPTGAGGSEFVDFEEYLPDSR